VAAAALDHSDVWSNVGVLVVVLPHQIGADIRHVLVRFPSIFLVTVSDPFNKEFVMPGVIVVGTGHYDGLGGPSLVVGVYLDWGWRSIGLTAVWFQERDIECGVNSPLRG
jgi:hypothetical protein